MRRKCSHPIKVFVTTPAGYTTYLVEDNDVFEAAKPFISRFRGMGYIDRNTTATQRSFLCLMMNRKTNEPIMVSSFQLYYTIDALD